MNNVKITKADLIEEVLGLLILTGTNDATRHIIGSSLHLVTYSEIRVYRDSLAEDVNLARQLPPLDMEEEI